MSEEGSEKEKMKRYTMTLREEDAAYLIAEGKRRGNIGMSAVVRQWIAEKREQERPSSP